MTTQSYACQTDQNPCLSPIDARKQEMLGYIRKKYNVPDGCEIVIKQGYITKDILPSPAMSWSDPYDDYSIIKRKLTGAATSAVKKMHELIDHTNEKIKALLEAWETDEDLQALSNDWLHDQITHIVDGMFIKLSDSIKTLVQESYEKVYAQSNEALGGRPGSAPFSAAMYEKERFKLIFAALEKAKARMTARIEEAFNAPAEPEERQKIGPGTIILGTLALLLLAAVLTGCEDTKKKAEQLSGDAEHLAKIEAKIEAFIDNGVEKYEIVTQPGCCDVCAEKADQFFDVADYSQGVNAPPFHPNCRCEVRVYAAENAEEPAEEENELPESASDDLLDFLKDYEKFYAMPYRGLDSQNRTVGYGHVILPEDGDKYDNGITEEEATELLKRDLERVVYQYLNPWLEENSVVLTQQQYDALVSFTFNLGQSWMNGSGLSEALLSGDFSEVGAQMMRWVNVNGSPSTGLYRRRNDEVNMFENGTYDRTYPDAPAGYR
jgi:GH24 family phage-related lysozyme (muramidase)